MSSTDAQSDLMRRAIVRSERVRGTTSPNPPVGAIVVDASGTVVGEGATQPPGGPHAEIMALRQAGSLARGGTAFVTLEPCAHFGRTPPCTDALIEAGISRVYYAVPDPNPLAAGGAEMLSAAGIGVHSGLLQQQVELGPLRAWLHFIRTGRPHITWKYASTLDGRAAAEDGTSRWISGPESRAEVHALRSTCDAIVVGSGTVLADDPALTARRSDGTLFERQPLRIVVGNSAIPADAQVLNDQAETVRVRSHDLNVVFELLADRGMVEVLLEGGPRLAGAFVAARRVDRLLAYLAPTLLGSGPAVLGDAGVSTISGAHRWSIEDVTMSGDDVRVSAVPSRAPEVHGN